MMTKESNILGAILAKLYARYFFLQTEITGVMIAALDIFPSRSSLLYDNFSYR